MQFIYSYICNCSLEKLVHLPLQEFKICTLAMAAMIYCNFERICLFASLCQDVRTVRSIEDFKCVSREGNSLQLTWQESRWNHVRTFTIKRQRCFVQRWNGWIQIHPAIGIREGVVNSEEDAPGEKKIARCSICSDLGEIPEPWTLVVGPIWVRSFSFTYGPQQRGEDGRKICEHINTSLKKAVTLLIWLAAIDFNCYTHFLEIKGKWETPTFKTHSSSNFSDLEIEKSTRTRTHAHCKQRIWRNSCPLRVIPLSFLQPLCDLSRAWPTFSVYCIDRYLH